MRVGAVGYCTSQGLAHLLRDFYRAGVVTDPILFHHSQRHNHREWYPSGTPYVATRTIDGPEVEAVLGRVQAMLFWETPFDWSLFDRCRVRGVKTVLVPMYEWFPRRPPALPDAIMCPSKLDLHYFTGTHSAAPYTSQSDWADRWAELYLRSNVKIGYLPIPVRTDLWQPRTAARRFLHNAGNVGHREHKGTRELLKAIPHIKSPLELTIRAQDAPTFLRLLNEIPERERSGGRASVRFEVGERPYESLWDGHDVLVAPEKQNGLSLPLQEARAAGMLVVTTDRFPANDWLPREPLIPVSRYERACISQNYLEFDSAVVDPKDIATVLDSWFEKDIMEYSRSGKGWAEENSWAALGPKWSEAIASCL